MSYTPFKARHVMGDFFTINTKDHEGNPQLEENKHHWFMGFAVPKGAQWDAVYNTMYQEAASDPACTKALCDQPGFNWKIEDCDAPDNPDNLGKDSRPAGHMLIKFTRYKSMGPVQIVDGNHSPIVNKTAIKRGDYFIVGASTKFNGAKTVKTNAGMYQNIAGLMFAESGVAIESEGSFDAATTFAGVQGGMVVNGSTPQGSVTPATVTPSAPVTPATDLVTPGVIVPPPPVVVEVKYNHEGVEYTKSQLVGFGFTEAHFTNMTPI